MSASTAPASSQSLALQYRHPVYSGDGEVAGFVAVDKMREVQVLLDPQIPEAAALAELPEGDIVEAELEPLHPGGGPRGRALYQLRRLRAISGRRTGSRQRPALPSRFAGDVLHLNYDRRGSADGVVLESGDFVHLGEQGMNALALKVGDHVVAEGPARPMRHGGYVLEAERVNGREVP